MNSHDKREQDNPSQLDTFLFIGVLTTVSFLYSVDRSMLLVMAQPIKTDLRISDSAFGLIVGILSGGITVLFAIPVARLADRTNRTYVLTGCFALWSGCTALSGIVRNVIGLGFARAGFAIGQAGATSIVHGLIGMGLPPERRATALGLVGAGIYSGTTGALFFGSWLAQNLGWRSAFVAVALPGLLLALLLPLLVKVPPAKARPNALLSIIPSGTNQPDSGITKIIQELLFSRAYVMVTVATAMCAGVTVVIDVWSMIFIMRYYDVSIGYAGFGLGISTGISSIIGLLVSTYLCRRAKHYSQVVRVPGIAFAVASILYLIAFNAPDAFSFLLLVFAPSFLAAMWYPALFATLQNVVPETSRVQATAACLIFVQLMAEVVFLTTVGWASDALSPHYGQESLRIVFMGVAVLGLAAAFLMLALDQFIRRAAKA